MTIIETRLPELDSITLASGGHEGLADGACVMEAVSYVAGEPWSDHPECACPVLNDEDRQKLKPYIPHLVGTRSTPEVEARRGRLASDWLIRTFTPAWLRLAGLTEHAEKIEAIGDTTGLSLDEINYRVIPIISAAGSAARSAADSAAREALAPTVSLLQSSAFELLDRMLAVTPESLAA